MGDHMSRFPRSGGPLLAALLAAAPAAWADDDGFYPFGLNELVVGEVDALRRQIARCWNVPAMTQREDFEVHVRVELRPDGTVRTARVVDYNFILADKYRFSVAQSARGALISRRCNPLKIPEERRRRGDRITLTLNPRVIFRRY